MNLTVKWNFSEGWLTCFKMCYGIRRLDVNGEKMSADKEGAEKYFELFQKLVEKHKLTTEQVYNADGTVFLYCCLPYSTLAGGGGVIASGHKSSKERLTVLVCANAAGTHKLKLFVVGKFKNPRAFKNVQHLPVDYKAQTSAWMNLELFRYWFHHIFIPAVEEHLRKT
jgi:hypothetical protein